MFLTFVHCIRGMLMFLINNRSRQNALFISACFVIDNTCNTKDFRQTNDESSTLRRAYIRLKIFLQCHSVHL